MSKACVPGGQVPLRTLFRKGPLACENKSGGEPWKALAGLDLKKTGQPGQRLRQLVARQHLCPPILSPLGGLTDGSPVIQHMSPNACLANAATSEQGPTGGPR